MKKTTPKTVFKPVPILLAFIAYLALVGCGTKGPLYIPEQRYPQKESAPETPKEAPPPAKAY